MEIFIITILIIFLMFAATLLFGAPYLPTLDKQTKAALKLLDLKPGQVLLDLGSGDGRILRAAARQGAKVRGYEINPVLVVVSMFFCLKERQLVSVKWENFWGADLAEADGIYVFALKKYMPKLDKKIASEISKPVKVVSYAFAFPDRQPLKHSAGLMLYEFKPGKN